MKPALDLRTSILLLLLCLTTTFCGPHDDTESLAQHADSIGASLPGPGAHRAAEDTPIVAGTTAGYLPGSSAVTATGEFTYRIDLDVPQGRSGLAPSLALVYGSRGGNGLLGVGWRLDGLSEIHRCAKTIAQDGTADGIDFNGDSLCLDNQKLVAVSSGGDTTEYRTEQDEMARIIAHEQDGEPLSFDVYQKNGRIREYTQVTPDKLVWLIASERDRAGNEIRYEYDVTVETLPPPAPGTRNLREPAAIEYHPSAIHFTYQRHSHDTARRKVVFLYEKRPDPTFAYVSGVKLATTQRLSAIDMHAPNRTQTGLVWRYTLGYTADKHRSRLASIQKCGALGGCLLAKQFRYERPTPLSFIRAHKAAEPSASGFRLVLDADGDGRDDLLFQGLGDKLYLRKTADGTPLLSQRIMVRDDTQLDGLSLTDTKPVDLDADGVPELVGLVSGKEYRFFRWNAAEKKLDPVWKPIAVSDNARRGKCGRWPPPEPAHFVDLNGDALPDLLKTIDGDPSPRWYASRWHYWLNQGDSFQSPRPVKMRMSAPTCFDGSRRQWSMSVDLFGDNRQTLVLFTSPQYSRPILSAVRLNDAGRFTRSDIDVPEEKKWVLIDLNGDGLLDKVIERSGKLLIWWNTGRSFLLSDSPLWSSAEDAAGDWQVADIDGDGDDDLVVMKGGSSPALIVFRYDSRSRRAIMRATPGIPPGQLGDFDGDGFLDIASLMDDGTIEVYKQVAAGHDLLVSVSDERSASPRETIAYAPSNRIAAQAPRVCRYPQQCIRRSMHVVRWHSRTGAGRRVYSYEDPRSDLRARGFLGFGKVHAWDPDTGAETTTTYDHETRVHETYPFALLPKEVVEVTPILEQRAPGQALPRPAAAVVRVEKRVNRYQAKWLHDNRTYFVHPESWTSWEWEQPATIDWSADALVHIGVSSDVPPRRRVLRKRTGLYRFDDYNNPLEQTIATEGGVKRTVISTYDIREDDWLVGLVLRRKITSSETSGTAPRVVEHAYDDRGLLTKTSTQPNDPDPDIPETTTFTRSPDDGLISAITRSAPGQPARTVSIDYGDGERVFPVRITNALDHTVQLVYHPGYGTVGTEIDANGVQTRRVHDDLGRLRSVLPQGGVAVTLGYEITTDTTDSRRLLGTRITLREDTGSESFTEFDLWDRPVLDASRGFDGAWIQRRTEYDALGHVSSQTRPGRGAPARARTEYRYDSLDRLLETVRPDGTRIQHRHTFFESRTWDAENHESYIVRDADGRIVRSVQKLGATELPVTYRYGEFDLIQAIVDAKGNLIEFDHDIRGRRTRMSHPDRGVTTYRYSGYGELRETTDALGHVTDYHRDLLGRVHRIDDADGTTELVWDASDHGIGMLSATTSPDGTRRSYRYDDTGRPTQLGWTVDGEPFSVGISYDRLGRLDALAYPEVPGRPRLTVRRSYNAAGYLSELTDTSGAATKLLWRVDGRNLDDALERGIYGNGLTTERTYDDITGRLKEINAGALYGLAYDYYADGLVKSRADSVGARRETFAYDALERLTSWQLEATGSGQATEYAFDDLGNLTKVLVNGQVVEENQYGGPGAGPHALTASTLHGSFGFDAKGRRTDGGGKQITYTEFDLPREITTQVGLTTFAYDAAGRRVKKAGPTGTTLFIGGLYERRTEPAGTKHVFYIEGTDGIVAQIVHDEGSGTSETQYVLTDAIGSVGVVTDASGQELERRYFAPFGQRIDAAGAPLPGDAPDVRIGFTGHRHDAELGLIHMRGRTYDPATRQFLTPDPIVSLPYFGQSYNPYAYSLNSPVSIVDPTGYQPAWASPYVPGSDSRSGWWGSIPWTPWSGPSPSIPSGAGSGASGAGSSASPDRWWQPPRHAEEPRPSAPTRAALPARPLPSGIVDASVDASSGQLVQLVQFAGDPEKQEIFDEYQAQIDEQASTAATFFGFASIVYPPAALVFFGIELARLQLALDSGDRAHITETALSLALAAVLHGSGKGLKLGGRAARGAPRLGPKWKPREITSAICETGCDRVATQIQKHIGGRIVTITPKSAPGLGGFRGKNWGWSYHKVVVKDGRVYDLTTGHKGLPTSEYKQLWQFPNEVNFGF